MPVGAWPHGRRHDISGSGGGGAPRGSPDPAAGGRGGSGALTQRNGLEVHRLQEVCQQCPLQAEHVPAQDLVAAGHGAQSLPEPDAVPRGHDVAGLHWDRAFPCGGTRSEPLPGVAFRPLTRAPKLHTVRPHRSHSTYYVLQPWEARPGGPGAPGTFVRVRGRKGQNDRHRAEQYRQGL